ITMPKIRITMMPTANANKRRFCELVSRAFCGRVIPGGSSVPRIGRPHFGQDAAKGETGEPQSGQSVSGDIERFHGERLIRVAPVPLQYGTTAESRTIKSCSAP